MVEARQCPVVTAFPFRKWAVWGGGQDSRGVRVRRKNTAWEDGVVETNS